MIRTDVAIAWSRGLTVVGVLLSAGPVTPSLAGQGPIVRERWTYARLETLRSTLAAACRGADRETLAAVARDLVAPTDGNPFGPPLRALARTRGVEPDAAFLYRGNVQAFVSPEVVDPDSTVEVCRDLNVTFYLPYLVEDPTGEDGAVELQVEVRDGDGDTVWEATVDQNTDVEQLLRYRAVCVAPGAPLRDGSYTLTASVYLDGAAPRPGDPIIEFKFSVLRGYQQRAEKLMYEDLRSVAEDPDLSALSRAIAQGAATEVGRAYAGAPAAGQSQPVVELERAERILANLMQGRPALSGLSGRVDLAVPTGHEDEIAFVTLAIPDPDVGPRPLVLFLPGGAAFDQGSWRPASPTMTSAGWWADLLIDRGFARSGEWSWAVMESPGRVANSVTALRGVVSALTGLLDVPAGQVCVVAERQGAWVASHALNTPDFDVAGLVLMTNGGNLPLAELDRRDLQVLGIPAFGHPSSMALQRLATRNSSDRVRILDDATRPWPIVLSVSLAEIEAFLETTIKQRGKNRQD